MSFLKKKWTILNRDSSLSPFQKICFNRDLKTAECVRRFVEINYEEDCFDPFLFKDMDKALIRVKQALKNKERIMIFGDYDVDGISSTAILFLGLKKLGAEVSYRLPHRVNDGYGLNKKFIQECQKIGVNLIITVDCGIANYEEVKLAQELEIDVIITDHHQVQPKIPPAIAILNPKQEKCTYPFQEIPGAVVAYKLIIALCFDLLPKEEAQAFIYSLLEIVALGIVADCCPIVSENRFLVKKALEKMAATNHEGLKKLMSTARVDFSNITASTLGFCLAPRLNAAGRIASPYYSLEVLLGKSEKIAVLEKLNRDRQKMVEKSFSEALELLGSKVGEQLILIAHSTNWHVGIVGLIAGKLTEKFHRPSIILQKKGDEYVASARSTEKIDIMQILSECQNLFSHFGGHKQAAGFSIPAENLDVFYKTIKIIAAQKINSEDLIQELLIDCEVQKTDIGWELLNEINQLAPFGIKNNSPVLLIKNLPLKDLKTIGANKKHLKMKTFINGQEIDILGFNQGDSLAEFQKQSPINLVFQMEKNIWRNNEKIQFRIIDWSPVEELA